MAREDGWSQPEKLHTNDYINMFNSGVMAVRANPRTIRMVEHWTHKEFMETGGHGDQAILNNVHTDTYVACSTPPTCMHASYRKNVTSVWMHPHFWEGSPCIQDNWNEPMSYGGACDTRRVYIHFLCTCCWDKKKKV
ncbi:hypothetical protein FOA52_004278 [Chlamydomonas sp. UWO 241]|nr:hypothetical protein FOA52_004278 [Chlamydomonas sp. UWO 241]